MKKQERCTGRWNRKSYKYKLGGHKFVQLAINPRHGVGEIMFGASLAEVETILGRPDGLYDEPREDDFEWEYPDIGIFVGFSRGDDPRVSSITVNGLDTTLFDEPVMGLSETELYGLFRSHNQVLEPTDWTDPVGKMVVARALGLYISIEFNKVTSLVCNPRPVPPNSA